MARFLGDGRLRGRGLLVSAALALVAWSLWHFLPPEPRLVIEGQHALLVLSPNGRALFTCRADWSGPPRLWDTSTGLEVTKLSAPRARNSIGPVFASSSRHFFYATDSPGLTLGEVRTGRQWTVPLPAKVQSVAASPAGGILAAHMENGTIFLVETATGRILDRLTSTAWGFCQFTTDEAYLVFSVAGEKESHTGLWNTRTCRVDAVLKTSGQVLCVSPDSRSVATRAPAGETGQFVLAVWDLDPAAVKPRARFTTKISDWMSWVTYSPDGKLLATYPAYGNDGVLEFWNIETGQRLSEVPTLLTSSYGVFSADGTRFAVSEERTKPWLAILKMYDVPSGQLLWEGPRRFAGPSVYPEFSPNGKWIKVFGGRPEGIQFVDSATGQLLDKTGWREPADVNTQRINLSTTPDRRLLLFDESGAREPGGLDKILAWLHLRDRTPPWDVVSVYEMDSGRVLFHLESSHTTSCSLLSDDGHTLVTQHADQLAVWDVPGRPALRWVLGVPAGLLMLGVLAQRWLRRRRVAA